MVLSLSDMSTFGALLHIAGSVLIVYGQTIVKVSHCIEESSGAGSTWLLPSMHHHPQWRRPDGKWRRQITGSKSYATVGWSAFGIGNILRFVSMRFAAQTVLSGLGSLQFVVIPAASRQILGIRPQLSTAVGVGIVLVGNFLIILFGPLETSFSLGELQRQWTQPAMRIFLFILSCALISLHILWRLIHRRRRQAEAEQRSIAQLQRRHKQEAVSLLSGGGGGNGNGGAGSDSDRGHVSDSLLWETPGSNEADLGDPSTLRMFVAALLFSAVSSFIGAWSVLFSKSLTYIVGAAPASLDDWYSWFVVLAFVGTAAYWIKQSNKGLKLYPASLIMPLMQAFWMFMSVLEGMIYFDEMNSLTTPALMALLLGLLLAIIGAVAMGLAGFFNEQPHMVAHATTPHRSNVDIELASSYTTTNGELMPLSLNDSLAEVSSSGRIDGISSPTLRDKTVPVIGVDSLGATLEAELARVASYRQSNWLAANKGWAREVVEKEEIIGEEQSREDGGGGGGGGGGNPLLSMPESRFSGGGSSGSEGPSSTTSGGQR